MYKLDRYLGAAPKKLQRALQAGEAIRPLSVKIKLTWLCNLACVMCSEWRIQGQPPPRANYFDSWEKLQAVLDDLIALKTKKIHFSGGEPLMSPFLDRAVSYLSQQGKHVSLVSNGTLWTRSRARSLIQSGLGHITFSVDSLDADVFRHLRGKDSWDKLMRGIANVREAIAESGRPIKLRSNTVLTRDNFRELRHYAEQAKALGIDQIRLLPVDDLHTEQRALRLQADEIALYNQEIAPLLAASAQRYGLMDSPEQAYPFGRSASETTAAAAGHYALGLYRQKLCFVPWLHSLIGADGRVFACCMLKGEKKHIDRLGPDKSFQSIWQGEAYQAFREQMQDEKPSICAHCDDFLAENRYLNHLLQSCGSQPQTAQPENSTEPLNVS